MTELNAARSAEYGAASFAGTVHATSVVIDGKAVLIAGRSGAGKSDLALRLIDRGATLLSDDYTHVEQQHESVFARAPATIAGQIEVYGVGILRMPHAPLAPAALIVQPSDEFAEQRLPADGQTLTLCGIPLPCFLLRFSDASAPIKVELALRHLLAQPAEQQIS